MVNVDEIFNKRCNKLCIFIKLLKHCWDFSPCIYIYIYIYIYMPEYLCTKSYEIGVIELKKYGVLYQMIK